jgi:parallel beta-helix repeat protein
VKKTICIIIIFMLLITGCTGKQNPPINNMGWYRLAYVPTPNTYIEVNLSLTPGFNPTGWNGSVWTALPNRPDQWDGSTNNLYTLSAANPIDLTNLTAGTTYYYRTVRVDEYGNRSDPEIEKSFVAGDVQRASTLVVAASDASPATRAGADFVCDGTNDDVEINDALTALPQIVIEGGTAQAGAATTITLRSTAGDIDDMYNGLVIYITSGQGAGQSKTITNYVGSTKVATVSTWATNPNNTSIYEIRSRVGKVMLTEGTFVINSSISMYSNTTLEGQGAGSILKIKDSKNADLNVISNNDQTNGNYNIKISNLTIDGNKGNNTSGNQIGIYFQASINPEVNNCKIKNTTLYGIYIYSNVSLAKISGNYFESTGGAGLYILSTNVNQLNISNNIFKLCYQGVYVSASFVNINTNNFDNCILDTIYLYAGDNNQVTGNTINGGGRTGVTAYSSSSNIISENKIKKTSRNGISISSSSNNNLVTGNHCESSGQSTNNTYSNIAVNDNCDDNSVINNFCRKGTETNKSKYGIAVLSSDCDRNLISGNDCYTSGETNGISNVGTNTSFGAGNRNNDGTWPSPYTPN